MDLKKISRELTSCFVLSSGENGAYLITTQCSFGKNKNINLYLKENGDQMFLSDNRNTLRSMNEVYDLKSTDVKNCINAVIEIYGFKIIGGEIVAKVTESTNLGHLICNFISCIGQLVNMYAFFDKP